MCEYSHHGLYLATSAMLLMRSWEDMQFSMSLYNIYIINVNNLKNEDNIKMQ